MPYKLRKAPRKNLYWVVGPDGKHHSKDPLPKARAEAQMKALYSAMRREEEAKIPTAREEKQIEKKMEGGVIPPLVRKYRRAVEFITQRMEDGDVDPEVMFQVYNAVPRDQHGRAVNVTQEHLDAIRAYLHPILSENHMSDLEGILDGANGGSKKPSAAFQLLLSTNQAPPRQPAPAPVPAPAPPPPPPTRISDIPIPETEGLPRTNYPRFSRARSQREGRGNHHSLHGKGPARRYRRSMKTEEQKAIEARRGFPDRETGWDSVPTADKKLLASSDDLKILIRNVMREKGYTMAKAKEWIQNLKEIESSDSESEEESEESDDSPDWMDEGLKGRGPLPELSILQQIAKAAYSTSPPQEIGPFKLKSSTPTLKFYVLPDPEDQRYTDTIVVGIRGTNTSDKQDLWADTQLALGKLEETPRWKKDLADFNNFMSRIRDANRVDVYGAAHSLGSAILDAFLKKGLIKKGVSYNGAISLGDAQKDIPNRRIYQEGDPLLAIMGRTAKNVEIRPKKKKEKSVGRKIADVASYFLPYVGIVTKGMDTLDAHALDNFIGGTHRTSVIKKLGLKDEGHSLTELAKASKIPRKTLQEVYNRGIGAYTTNPSSVRMKGTYKKGVDAPMSQKLSKEQWAMARVYSFIDGNPKHDTDLRGGGPTTREYTWIYNLNNTLVNTGKFIIPKKEDRRPFQDFLLHYAMTNRGYEVEGMGGPNAQHTIRLAPPPIPLLLRDLPPPPRPATERAEEVDDEYGVVKHLGLGSSVYLRQARAKAKAYGLDPKKLVFATDGKHKFSYDGVLFGREGYGDSLSYAKLEKEGKVPKGTTEMKKRVFHQSHEKIKGNWKANKVSPNNLALHILW